MLDKEKIIDNQKFYRWSNIEASIKTERPIEYNIDEFFNDIRQDLDKVKQPYCYVINNTINGKTADDFLCPSMVFIDIDFHFKKEEDKILELKRFYEDTDTKSCQEFVDKMKNDKHCISAGISKSGYGVRLFFNVVTNFYEDSLNFDLDYSTDMNKQIHKSNWEYIMRYLSLYYNLDLDAKYTSDKSANKLSQVTFRYRKDGSFYNKDWEPIYNKECFVREKEKYTLTKDVEKYESTFLDDLYKDNEEIFKETFSHYDKFNSLHYALRTQPENIQHWFYIKIKENYQGKGYKYLDSFQSFKSDMTKNDGIDLPLKAFLFKRGIIYSEPYTFETAPKIEDEKETKEYIVPDSIYKKLPKILQDLTSDFIEEKKDALLLSSLNCLSYYFSNIKFDYYFNDNQYNNFYIFLIANSSSGKSVINNAKKLLYSIDKYFRDKFLAENHAYSLLDKKIKETTLKPNQITVICGGDATRQGLYKALNNSNGKLILFDTEADSLMIQKGDYDYSTLIRKSLQNESFSKILAGQDAQYIDTPKLNICISGTKNQLLNVIGEKGSENGTFNRFLFYQWDTEPIIESPHTRIKYNMFEDYDKLLFNFYFDNLYLDGILTFEFSEEQEKIFDEELKKTHKEWLGFEDDSASGIIKRHFLIAKKLSITIASLRLFDEYKINKEDLYSEPIKFNFSKLTISNEDLLNVIDLIKILIKHSMLLFRKYTPIDEELQTIPWKVELYNLLPDTFSRVQVLNLSKKFKKCSRTIDRFLKKLRDDMDIEFNDKENYKKLTFWTD